MITVICDKTGIEFEATSKRQKNHPRVSAFLDEANKDSRRYQGSYQAAQQILVDIKANGMTDIDEAMQYANAAYNAWKNGEAKPVIRQTVGSILRAKKDASRARDEQNAFLRSHGYRWQKDYADFDEYEEGEPSAWNLYSSDGRIVSVAEAYDEINRGVDVVLAERKAVAATIEKLQVEHEAAEEAAENAWNEARKVATDGMVEVKRFDYSGFTLAYDYDRSNQYITMYDRIYAGRINGVDCTVVYGYTGGHDYSERTRYYCADPARAGLTPVKQPEAGSLSETFRNFFGE